MKKASFLKFIQVLLLHLSMACLASGATTNITMDQTALLALKAHVTSDPNTILTNWSVDSSVCNWIGVTCGTKRQRVTALNLSYMDLGGTIPPEMGNLSFLASLSLRSNSFHSFLPNELARLHRLKMVDFGFNFFSGKYPSWFCSLPKLRSLVLKGNSFNGSVSILSSSRNMSSLRTIDLSINSLSGMLPVEFFHHHPQLNELFLSGNQLYGHIPSSISNASKLTSLDLSNNLLSGVIPNTLGNLRRLQVVNLAYNNLTLESSSPKLGFFSSLTNCQHLRRLELSGNPLNVILPISIGNLSSSLQYFLASHCNIGGYIPSEMGNLSSLVALNLGKNELNGTIPTTIGGLRELQVLDLRSNLLEGTIPYSLCRLLNLAFLSLGGNKLNGPISSCFGNLTSLRNLSLSSNKLTSSIPLTLWSLKDILAINMSSNSLSGSLPVDIRNLYALIELDLSRNHLSGNIPMGIGLLQNLAFLSLAKNGLQGSIPILLNMSVSLEYLDLSYNHLSGTIPLLGNLLYLQHFNVSFNRLQGEIPIAGPFANFTAQSYMNNTSLCGAARLQVQPCRAGTTTPEMRKGVRIILIPLVLLPVATALVLSLVYVLVRCQKRTSHLTEIDATDQRISYLEIMQATDGFSESNLLGAGSYGSVYKGTLKDGFIVAVKVFDIEMEQGFKSFDVECKVIRSARHRNIVSAFSSCCNMDFKALVLEYMPNGSLSKWLHSHNYRLDILQRLDIMIDVASAVEYLHYSYSRESGPIVHCDLKPSNVLLDENMVARVSDFSISKLLSHQESAIQTMTLATIGYMAPEFGWGMISTKCDVYSFGIILMETFTGKKPVDEMFGGVLTLRRWVEESLPHSVHEIADSNLLKTEEEIFQAKKNCIASVMRVALFCTLESATERVHIKGALCALKEIRTEFVNFILGGS